MNTDQKTTNENLVLSTIDTSKSFSPASGSVISVIKKPQEKELEQVSKIQNSINIYETNDVLKFGIEAQESITNFTDTILAKVQMKELNGAGESLESMIEEMKKIDFSSISKSDGLLANLPILGDWIKKGTKKIVGDFETAKDKLENMLKILVNQEQIVKKDVETMDLMYKENMQLVRNLEIFIWAGEERLLEFKQEENRLKELASSTDDAMDVQNYRAFNSAVSRFEKRLLNLKIARVQAIQAGGQIKLVQSSDQEIIEDIHDTIHTTLPMWKRQFVLAISLSRQEKALKISQTVKDYTNEQYKNNAEKMYAMNQKLETASSRGVLDINTMKEVNELYIQTIKEKINSSKKGAQARAVAEKELFDMDKNMKQALLDASNSIS